MNGISSAGSTLGVAVLSRGVKRILMPSWGLPVCVGILCCSSVVGCAATGGDVGSVRLAAGRSVEPDIPVPEGFRLAERASEDRATSRGRLYLRHEYTGAADKFAVREFYREQMSTCRWRLSDDTNVGGELTLRFKKNSENCSVRITDRAGLWGRPTRVRIIVSREEQADDPPDVGNNG